jgi:hypothetical protein
MKSTFSVTALSGLLLVLAATASGPAASAPFPLIEQEPAYLLAGGDSSGDQLLQAQILRNQLREDKASGEEQRFSEMLIVQPTAAGPQFEPEDAQSSDGSALQQNMGSGPGRVWVTGH